VANVLIIDFDDSFTFNIKEILTSMNIESDVLNWKELNNETLDQYKAFVFGPGPGHPNEYVKTFPLIKNILGSDKFYFGICLGHQLLWSVNEREVVQVSPIHGESLTINIENSFLFEVTNQKEIDVQFYNSLKVLSKSSDLESNYLVEDSKYLMASKNDNFCTYQFHPESIGSSCPEALFRPLKDFLYN